MSILIFVGEVNQRPSTFREIDVYTQRLESCLYSPVVLKSAAIELHFLLDSYLIRKRRCKIPEYRLRV